MMIMTPQSTQSDYALMASNKRKRYTRSREDWCNAIVNYLSERLRDDFGIVSQGPKRSIKIAIAPVQRAILGITYPSSRSVCGTVNLISISPIQASPEELCITVLHELLHAHDDCHSHHKNRWARWAANFSLQAKGHAINEVGQKLVDDAVAKVGQPERHTTQLKNVAKRAASLVKMSCPECSQVAYAPAKALNAGNVELVCGFDGETLVDLTTIGLEEDEADQEDEE